MNFVLIETLPLYQLCERKRGEREIEGETELAKVAEGSQFALSLIRFIALALLLSPSLTLFADHHHRHTISSVCVCVCVCQTVSLELADAINK